MRNAKCYTSLFLLFSVASLVLSSCRREGELDNTKVIRTPYTVFFGQRNGEVTKTNDGLLYKDLFLPDGVPARAITISGNNIIFIKNFLRISVDNGKNFNQPYPGQPIPAVNPAARWSSMILDVPGDWLYVSSATAPHGVQTSKDNGVTWSDDDVTWPNSITSASVGSLVQTTDKYIYGLDPTGANIYRKGPPPSTWGQVSPATGLPAGTRWYLAAFNNTVVAADYNGTNGIHYSNDQGLNWAQFTGIPNNQEILSCAAPLGQVLLAGTDSAGIFRLVGNNFVPSNNGLLPFTSVYGIAGKQDLYKNGIIKRYVYITTNRGLYRSEDLGQNWVLMYPEDLRAIW